LTEDWGKSWKPVNYGFPPEAFIISFAIKGDTIFAGNEGGIGVYKTSIDSINWIKVNNGIIDTYYITTINVNNGDVFIGTTNGVYRSSDNGNNWNQVNYGLSSTTIISLAVKGSNIMLVPIMRVFFLSKDYGNTWKSINGNLPKYYIYDICLDDSSIFMSSSGGVFKSNDNGSQWSIINNNSYVISMVLNGNKLILGSDSGKILYQKIR